MSQNPLFFATSLQNTSDIITTTSHNKHSLQCKICTKTFSTNGNLKNHILTIHHNLRPFKCEYPNCNKSFSNKSRLLVHERTHTGQKPFTCHICNKTFNEKGNLKTHICFHSNYRPFICKTCGKSYKTNGHLKDHFEIHHLGLKKFNCDLCGAHFGRSSTLKAHLRTHTGERNYVCPIEGCEKAFTEKGNMRIHYWRHMKKTKKLEKSKGFGLFEMVGWKGKEREVEYEEVKNVEIVIGNRNGMEDKKEKSRKEEMK